MTGFGCTFGMGRVSRAGCRSFSCTGCRPTRGSGTGSPAGWPPPATPSTRSTCAHTASPTGRRGDTTPTPRPPTSPPSPANSACPRPSWPASRGAATSSSWLAASHPDRVARSRWSTAAGSTCTSQFDDVGGVRGGAPAARGRRAAPPPTCASSPRRAHPDWADGRDRGDRGQPARSAATGSGQPAPADPRAHAASCAACGTTRRRPLSRSIRRTGPVGARAQSAMTTRQALPWSRPARRRMPEAKIREYLGRRPRPARPAPGRARRRPADPGREACRHDAATLVIMGSGETAPTMVKPHRAIFELAGDRRALLLDTPYGFQSNADEISAKAVGYFATASDAASRSSPGGSRHRPASTASGPWRRCARPAGCSPGRAAPRTRCAQWRDTPIPDVLVETLARAGVVLFASAAALTLGSHTIPGVRDLQGRHRPALGARPGPGVATDRAAGGGDPALSTTPRAATTTPASATWASGGCPDWSRNCPTTRSSSASTSTPPSNSTWPRRCATVVGNGRLTIRRPGHQHAVPDRGSTVPFDDFLSTSAPSSPVVGGTASPNPNPSAASSLLAETEAAEAAFDAALASRDVDGCVAAILDLDRALMGWSADTDVATKPTGRAAALRRMVVRLGELATVGARDPRETPRPVRGRHPRTAAARPRGGATSPRRTGSATGWTRPACEVRDTPAGATWTLR